ncbi:MAG: TlpA disulfide reductase family protein [Acidobacteriota bacterium]
MSRNQPNDVLSRRARLLAVGVLLGAGCLATTVSGDTLPALFQQHGIRPVEPASPAADFELPDLSGSRRALSDARGTWVVLTFFATWCGPCRHEMPTLERLHQAKAAEGITVLGVSIDDSKAPLPHFLNQMGVTFPVLWDENGQAGSTYRATSIPLTYLIDPAGRIVGVSRGARDWEALGPMLSQAATIMPPDAATESAWQTASGPVDLPSEVTPPTAVVQLSSATPRPGKIFELTIEIRWSGTFDEYLLHPPRVALPEGVRASGNTRAETTSRAGRNVITYSMPLVAEATGRFALDPVELLYTPRFESQQVSSRLAGPVVEVEDATFAGFKPRTVMVAGTGAAVAGLLAGLALVGLGRRRKKIAQVEAPPQLAGWEETVAEARRHRLQGEPRKAFLALAELARELDPQDTTDLVDTLDKARYGGYRPSREELERLERRVELLLREHRPDERAAERRSIRLRPDSRQSMESRNPMTPENVGS